MSRPIGLPACSCWRTFPKNSKLSLISSVYFTWPPYCLSKDLRTFLSMYSGQLANVHVPIATFGWLTAAAFLAWPVVVAFVPLTPPHAARNADRPAAERP